MREGDVSLRCNEGHKPAGLSMARERPLNHFRGKPYGNFSNDGGILFKSNLDLISIFIHNLVIEQVVFI